MKKNINLKKYIPYLILFFITVLVGFQLLSNRLLKGDDAVFHLFRCYSTRVAILDKQLIPMINPNMLGGFGFCYNMFYGILPTYAVTLLSFITPTIEMAINIFILLTIFLSGITMYKFILDMTKNKFISFLSAVFYMLSPYHLYDIFDRMALGEITAFIFVPLVFHGLYSIIEKKHEKWYLLTIGTAGLLLSHTISAFMVAIFAFFYLLLNIKKVWNKKIIKKIITSLIWALFIALPNLLPLLQAKIASNYMVFNSDYMKTTGKDMYKRSISLKFSSDALDIIAILTLIITFIITMYVIYLIKKKKKKITWIPYLILTIISIIFTFKVIPWHYLPEIFSKPQFPWRYLELTNFFSGIVIALLFGELDKEKIKKYLYIPIIICLLLTIPIITIGLNKKRIDHNLLQNNSITLGKDKYVKSSGTATSEYLPEKAIYNYEYLVKRGNLPIMLNQVDYDLKNFNKNGTRSSFDINVTEKVNVELSYIYYPGYIVKINNKKIDNYETDNGLLGFDLEKGKYHVEVYYRGTLLMIISYIVSIISIITLIFVEKKYYCLNIK